jgi:hypothetical protein
MNLNFILIIKFPRAIELLPLIRRLVNEELLERKVAAPV